MYLVLLPFRIKLVTVNPLNTKGLRWRAPRVIGQATTLVSVYLRAGQRRERLTAACIYCQSRLVYDGLPSR
jgi:hypothetical protein